ncbi:hypothetical protein [Amycolatopsis antarctica]|uniref:hypothetical protein n=1 Tax=Amycolatopsis antarctica TaxID=1854586 RepID=UPI0026AB19B3
MDAITATYVQDEDDWTITVAGLGKEFTGRAPGIIAARDRADQLVEKLSPVGKAPTVVHLLGGSALEFTTAYMTARLTRPQTSEAPATQAADEAPAAEDNGTEAEGTNGTVSEAGSPEAGSPAEGIAGEETKNEVTGEPVAVETAGAPSEDATTAGDAKPGKPIPAVSKKLPETRRNSGTETASGDREKDTAATRDEPATTSASSAG